MTFKKILGAFLCCVTSVLSSANLQADVILDTEFEGTTPSGTTLNGVQYNVGANDTLALDPLAGVTPTIAPVYIPGVTVSPTATNLAINNTVQSGGGDTGNLFATPQASGWIVPDNNTGNGGEWNIQVDFTTGANDIALDDLIFQWRNFNGNGLFQNNARNSEITIDVLQGMTSVLAAGGPTVLNTVNQNTNQNSAPDNRPLRTEQIGLSGTLAAGTTYTLFFQAGDATTAGNHFGLEAIRLNGTEVIQAIPEPSSLALIGMFGSLGLVSRRRR